MPALREVQGVKFLVHTPSIWMADWPPVSIVYVGDGWMICSAAGAPLHCKPYATKKEAIDLIIRSVPT